MSAQGRIAVAQRRSPAYSRGTALPTSSRITSSPDSPGQTTKCSKMAFAPPAAGEYGSYIYFISSQLIPVRYPSGKCLLCDTPNNEAAGTKKPMQLDCGHVFHENCIKAWVCSAHTKCQFVACSRRLCWLEPHEIGPVSRSEQAASRDESRVTTINTAGEFGGEFGVECFALLHDSLRRSGAMRRSNSTRPKPVSPVQTSGTRLRE